MPVETALGPEHLQRRLVVDVVAAREGGGERFVARQVRQHAQLDLRVVGRDQHVSGFGDERAADLPAQRRADRDVLQVRIAAAQASRRGDRLVEHRVHATGDRMHERRQRVDVGALQLGEAAPVEDQPRQVVGQREFFEHFHRRGRRARGARALQHRQLQLVEEHLAELLGRADVERLAGLPEDLGGQRVHLVFHPRGLAAEGVRVDLHADAFQAGQNRHERQFELVVHRGHARGLEFRHEAFAELPRQIRPLARVVDELRRRHGAERHRLGALAAHVVGEPRAVAELFEGQRLQVLARSRGVEQVPGDHRVGLETGQRDAVAGQHDGGELQVVTDLADRAVFEHALQRG